MDKFYLKIAKLCLLVYGGFITIVFGVIMLLKILYAFLIWEQTPVLNYISEIKLALMGLDGFHYRLIILIIIVGYGVALWFAKLHENDEL